MLELNSNFDIQKYQEHLLCKKTVDRNLLRLKSGGSISDKPKIKIKKKNEGKFTDYCGGNVTLECINKAKASGNKTLIKRAAFALNARKWNHKILKNQGGNSFTKKSDLNNAKLAVAKQVYEVLKSLDIPDYVIYGVLGNIDLESGFNPNIRSASGKFNGLTLISPDIKNYITKNYGWNVIGQTKYIADYINGKLPSDSLGYKSKEFRRGAMLSNDSALVAELFRKYYERCSPVTRVARLNSAKYWEGIFNKMNNATLPAVSDLKPAPAIVEQPVSTYVATKFNNQ